MSWDQENNQLPAGFTRSLLPLPAQPGNRVDMVDDAGAIALLRCLPTREVQDAYRRAKADETDKGQHAAGLIRRELIRRMVSEQLVMAELPTLSRVACRNLLEAAHLAPLKFEVARSKLELRGADLKPAELKLAQAKLKLSYTRKLFQLRRDLQSSLAQVQSMIDSEIMPGEGI